MEESMIVVAAAVGGFIAGAILTALFFQSKIKALKAKSPAAPTAPMSADRTMEPQFFRKMGKAHDLVGRQKTIDVVDSNVTRSDVERASRVGLEYHLNDMVQEIKENKRLNHLIRIVINGFPDPMWENEDLREYFHAFDQDHPEAVFFIEEKSLSTYLRILREARIAHYEAPLEGDTDLDTMKKHLLQDKASIMEKYQAESDLFFANLLEGDERDLAIKICDEVMERISNAIDKMP